jgi:hypothetical protein
MRREWPGLAIRRTSVTPRPDAVNPRVRQNARGLSARRREPSATSEIRAVARIPALRYYITRHAAADRDRRRSTSVVDDREAHGARPVGEPSNIGATKTGDRAITKRKPTSRC